MTANPIGVSVVICCHNSAKRLPRTLRHLAAEPLGDIPWEVVVVDHKSTDGTEAVAQLAWPTDHPVPLRVVDESRAGLSLARERGLSEAQFDIVSFLDDDNWVEPGWIATVAEVMLQHPQVGICGGYSEEVCEIDPPAWFERNKLGYAVGAQGDRAGDVTETRGSLWGAGLTLRKSAWEDLVSRGFRQSLHGGPSLDALACEDTELCLAFRIAGWRLWYEPRLRFRHFIPADRLEWNHVRRKERRGGRSSVGLDAYNYAMKPQRTGVTAVLRQLRQSWYWQVGSAVGGILRSPHKLVRYLVKPEEGSRDVLTMEAQIGRLEGLIKVRNQYPGLSRRVRDAKWRERTSLLQNAVANKHGAVGALSAGNFGRGFQ